MTPELTILTHLADYLATLRRMSSFEEAQVALDEEAKLRRRIEKLESVVLPPVEQRTAALSGAAAQA